MAGMQALASGSKLLQHLGVQHPIVLAPMAGFSTPELVAKVADAGCLAMFGGGQSPKEQLRKAIQRTKALMLNPSAKFGVNLFVPAGFYIGKTHWTQAQQTAVERAAQHHQAALAELAADSHIVTMPPSPSYDAHEATFSDQIDVILEENVPVASFHFGWPSKAQSEKLRSAGVFLIGNATSIKEARILEDLGADAIIAQGQEAGGHRGTFIDADMYQVDSMIGVTELTRAIVDAVCVPVIAAGGLMDGVDVVAVLAAGASAAQMGTAFLTTLECAAPPDHKQCLLQKDRVVSTVVTQAFTGKPARALHNKWIENMNSIDANLPNCFNGMPGGRVLQGVAVKEKCTDVMYMWAGQAYSRCRPAIKADELVVAIAAEIETAIARKHTSKL